MSKLNFKPLVVAGVSQRQAGGAAAAEPPEAASLWVDKYSPRSFMDLLSDEQINREVMRWMKVRNPY